MDPLVLGGRQFNSRLFVGTGKCASGQLMADVVAAAACEMVTVALRRVDLENPGEDLLSHLDPEKILLLVNTSGATTAVEAIRLAHLARSAGFAPWVKIEVIPDARWLMPDPLGTLEASAALAAEGFIVLPYIQADPVLAHRLEEAGCAAVMPLAAPIGSNRGLETLESLKMIIEQASIPVVIDAGLGAPSHAAAAMELGADAVLVNTAIATAENPVAMAAAFAQAVAAGRQGYLAGLPGVRTVAEASSPLTGFLEALQDGSSGKSPPGSASDNRGTTSTWFARE